MQRYRAVSWCTCRRFTTPNHAQDHLRGKSFARRLVSEAGNSYQRIIVRTRAAQLTKKSLTSTFSAKPE
jgi:hypothetical protein